MLKLPSNHATSSIFYSRDPAFAFPVPPPPLPEGAPAAAVDEHAAAVERYKAEEREWARRVEQARETGVVTDLCVEGATPTYFSVRPMPSPVFRKLVDKATGGEIGNTEAAAIAFRACVTGVANLDGVKVKIARHPEYGDIENGELVQLLDQLSPSIVSELGGLLIQKASAPGPK